MPSMPIPVLEPKKNEAVKGPLCPYGQSLKILKALIARETDDCILWPYAHNEKGYGQLEVNGILRKAHVVAWSIHNRKPIPRYKKQTKRTPRVLHRCDVRNCINPRHLFRGTQKKNLEDMVQKGRNPRGETHHLARLSSAQIKEIRSIEGKSCSQIAEMYGIGGAYVWMIRAGKSRTYD